MEQTDRKQIWNSQILLYEMLEARESRYKKAERIDPRRKRNISLSDAQCTGSSKSNSPD